MQRRTLFTQTSLQKHQIVKRADLGMGMCEFCSRIALAERRICSTPKKGKKKVTMLTAYTQKIDQSGWGGGSKCTETDTVQH